MTFKTCSWHIKETINEVLKNWLVWLENWSIVFPPKNKPQNIWNKNIQFPNAHVTVKNKTKVHYIMIYYSLNLFLYRHEVFFSFFSFLKGYKKQKRIRHRDCTWSTKSKVCIIQLYLRSYFPHIGRSFCLLVYMEGMQYGNNCDFTRSSAFQTIKNLYPGDLKFLKDHKKLT